MALDPNRSHNAFHFEKKNHFTKLLEKSSLAFLTPQSRYCFSRRVGCRELTAAHGRRAHGDTEAPVRPEEAALKTLAVCDNPGLLATYIQHRKMYPTHSSFISRIVLFQLKVNLVI